MTLRLANIDFERFTSPSPHVEIGNGFDLSSFTGRLVEFSGWGNSARLTAAFGIVIEAQKKNEPVAWITLKSSSFFPPDAAAGGVDLDRLVVVRVSDARSAGRAADHLLRSGGFGLVVIDLPAEKSAEDRLAMPLLTRLLGLAQKHESALLVLTEKAADHPSLCSLVSLRATAARVRRNDLFELQLRILKDKRRGPGGDVPREICRGPAGVR